MGDDPSEYKMACFVDAASADREVERYRVARVTEYLLRQLGQPVPVWLAQYSDTVETWRNVEGILCDELRGLDDETRDRILYARTREARRLADWWEDHQKADREREQRRLLETMY